MAITENKPLATTTGQAVTVERPLGVLTRPQGDKGWTSWLSSVDHKRIGIMYGVGSMLFFLVGGIEALLLRVQLAVPEGSFLSEDVYNQIFTMHGVTMVFLVIMPMAAAFANYLIPLQIGARDVAFPRLNAFSFWCWLAGALFLNSSWFMGGAPDGGWFAYAPNTSATFSPGNGMDFYAIGLQIAGIASLVSAINLIVTVLNMRAKGMDLLKMPIFTWMLLVTQFLLLFGIPVITVALFLLTFDRSFGANFFNVAEGGSPLLWQHLFWIFGHPEVYILILPAFGVLSEVIPVFSRKPIFGYPFMVGSGIAIAFLGFGVWAHHMFASGLGPISVAAFSVATMFIAVPTGVKILNWLATMWGGRLRFTTAMLFAVGTVSMFTIGGLSGVTHSISPSDTQQTDTYYIVAHFHYVIFGGALMGLFSGFYFWWPKVFGHMLNETLGKINFWVMLIGFNMTFGPMHLLGLQGMARRHHSYADADGFNAWNLVVSIGAFIIALGVAFFLINTVYSALHAKKNNIKVGPDPWDSRSLEWSVASPTPAHNFDFDPVVAYQDDWWHRKWAKDENGRIVRIAYPEDIYQDGSNTNVHLPSPSYWPLVLSFSLPILGYAIIYSYWLLIPFVVLFLSGFVGWALEPADDPEAARGHHDDHDHSAEGEEALAAVSSDGTQADSDQGASDV